MPLSDPGSLCARGIRPKFLLEATGSQALLSTWETEYHTVCPPLHLHTWTPSWAWGARGRETLAPMLREPLVCWAQDTHLLAQESPGREGLGREPRGGGAFRGMN